MAICGKPILKKLSGLLHCEGGHHFLASERAPGSMTLVERVGSEESRDSDHEDKVYPMGEVCPHPDYFAEPSVEPKPEREKPAD